MEKGPLQPVSISKRVRDKLWMRRITIEIMADDPVGSLRWNGALVDILQRGISRPKSCRKVGEQISVAKIVIAADCRRVITGLRHPGHRVRIVSTSVIQ